MRNAMRRLFVPMIVALSLALVAGCSASVSIGDGSSTASGEPTKEDKAYAENGVTFTYPGAFSPADVTVASSKNVPTWDQGFGAGNDSSYLWLAYYADAAAPDTVTAGNIEQIGPVFTKILEGTGAVINGGPTVTTLGELPALSYDTTFQMSSGETVGSHVLVGFDGSDEYFLNCQYTPADKIQVEAACSQVATTFAQTP